MTDIENDRLKVLAWVAAAVALGVALNVFGLARHASAAGTQWDLLAPAAVDARHHKKNTHFHKVSARKQIHKVKRAKVARQRMPVAVPQVGALVQSQNEYWDRPAPGRARGSVSLAGVTPVLAAKARQIVVACGSKVISSMRHTRVRGTGRMSLHASGRAVDIQGNPKCIAEHLKGWAGGASNDYFAVRPNHYHVSWGGREHGTRFSHYGRTRHAKRYKHRVRIARLR